MKSRFIIIICSLSLANLLIPDPVAAQEQSSAVQLHGTNVLIGQYSNRQGTNSEVPKEFLRNDFQMTMTVSDIPIASSFFITTEQKDYMQRINNLSFSIDLNTLKRNKARVEAYNKANQINNGKAPWMLRFLSNFSKIEGGTFRPDYGDLTLKGISVTGVNLELNNKVVYAAFAAGNLKRLTEETNNFQETYKQKLLFGKFGFGEKRTTHFYLTYMHISDETSQPLHSTEQDNATLKPQSNVIIGAEFRLSFLKNKWIIDGEAGASALTRDTRIEVTYDSVIVDSILRKVPEFLIDAVNPNISTSADYAYGFDTKLNLRTTTISGGYKWIGPGFFTLGNPMLVNDRQTMEARVDQALLNRTVSVSAYYKRFKDNLIDWKRGTTISNAYGLIAKVTFKKAPYIMISFTPNSQETNGDHLLIRNNMNIISLSSGYKYPLGPLMSFTSLSYFFQDSKYERDTIFQHSNTQTVTLNQVANFVPPLQVNFNAGFSRMKYSSTNSHQNVISFVLSGSHTYKEIWKNTVGTRYMNSKGESDTEETVAGKAAEHKLSLFWDTQIEFWKDWVFGLNIDENIFRKGNDAENYNEFIAQFKLILKW